MRIKELKEQNKMMRGTAGVQTIMFVIAIVIALTALAVLFTGGAVLDYYYGITLLDANASVPALFIIVVTFVPIGYVIALLARAFVGKM